LKKVPWQDAAGKRHIALVRDGDDEETARKGYGIPVDPPDVEQIDWSGVARDLHNELLARDLITKDDVVRSQTGVTGAILAALRRKVLALYDLA
jgi:hypothetical protein